MGSAEEVVAALTDTEPRGIEAGHSLSGVPGATPEQSQLP